MAEEVTIENNGVNESNNPNVTNGANGQMTSCPGDCNRCTPMHRSYCASQIAYNMQNAVARIESAVGLLSLSLTELRTKVFDLDARLAEEKNHEEQQPDFIAPEPENPGKKKK